MNSIVIKNSRMNRAQFTSEIHLVVRMLSDEYRIESANVLLRNGRQEPEELIEVLNRADDGTTANYSIAGIVIKTLGEISKRKIAIINYNTNIRK